MQSLHQTPSPPQTPASCPYCRLNRQHFIELVIAVMLTFTGAIVCARWSPPTIFTDIAAYLLMLTSSFLFGALILSYSIHARRSGVCGAGPDGGPAPSGGVKGPTPSLTKESP
jgi:hypothetical protein